MFKTGYLLTIASLFVITGCSSVPTDYELEPIVGSITYNGQPRTKLRKVPIGSTFQHEFNRNNGDLVIETYQVEEDRNIKILNRRIVREWMMGPDR